MIENVSIIGFNKGIFMTGGELFIDDSSIHDNSTGIECNTGRISIENVRIQNNNVGLQLNGTANAPAPAATTMSRSLISGSRDFGAVVINNSRLAMQDCMVTNNQVGIDLRAVSSALKAFVQARSGRSR
jgi:nitrous oxidase accessory protein NosD